VEAISIMITEVTGATYHARQTLAGHDPGRRPDAHRTPPGRPPDAMKPGFHGVGTHWIRGFMAFWLARRTRTKMPMVPV